MEMKNGIATVGAVIATGAVIFGVEAGSSAAETHASPAVVHELGSAATDHLNSVVAGCLIHWTSENGDSVVVAASPTGGANFVVQSSDGLPGMTEVDGTYVQYYRAYDNNGKLTTSGKVATPDCVVKNTKTTQTHPTNTTTNCPSTKPTKPTTETTETKPNGKTSISLTNATSQSVATRNAPTMTTNEVANTTTTTETTNSAAVVATTETTYGAGEVAGIDTAQNNANFDAILAGITSGALVLVGVASTIRRRRRIAPKH